ncbi:hypothetical protein AXF42_Ash009667 [Apostasia shenzhenica]|uniref:Uncharacterized protein n=1 Tax=Apostasia shenzhenica TaxID=1088818 RepID=A0A2I0AWQ7_9ASPA|nr:hypothetical protein AXF42_Ash009667 [Apostasia shenzhenica]
MKKDCVVAAASVAAASSSFVVSSFYNCRPGPSVDNEGSSSRSSKEAGSGSRRGRERNNYAPRFDGLRFIETLVTAHR